MGKRSGAAGVQTRRPREPLDVRGSLRGDGALPEEAPRDPAAHPQLAVLAMSTPGANENGHPQHLRGALLVPFPFVPVAVNDTFAYFSGFLGCKVFVTDLRPSARTRPGRLHRRRALHSGGGLYVPLLLNHRFRIALRGHGPLVNQRVRANPRVFGPRRSSASHPGQRARRSTTACAWPSSRPVAPFGFFARPSSALRPQGLRQPIPATVSGGGGE